MPHRAMPSSVRRRSAVHAQQRGSVLVNVAAGLSLMVVLLASIDLGFLFYYKREYQKAADLAALAGANELAQGCTAAVNAGTDSANTNLSEHTHDTPTIQTGLWKSTTNPRFVAGCDTQSNAVRALVFGSIPTFFLGGRTLSAEAIALAMEPIAQLRIRSTVASLNDGLLNDVTGALLGGSVSLSALSWQGLLNTDINLLSYLDALAIELGIDAGNYDQVLGADVTLGQLLDVAADVLNEGGGTGDVSAAIGGLDALSVLNLPAFSPLLQLGDLLNIQTGTPASGLDTALNVLDLVQGSVQLASSECAVCATVPVNLPGVAGVQVRTRIIEPPQLSAIGRPDRAKADPLGPDKIFVRTAQARTLISVDLPISGSVLSSLEALLNNSLVNGVTNAVNDVLTLDLVGLVTSLSCLLACDIQEDVTDIDVLPTPRLDINVDAGTGQAYVTDYACGGDKSLDVPTHTAVANLRIGKMGSSAADAANQVFASSSAPTVEAVPLLDIGSYRARYQCTLLLLCTTTWRTSTGTWTSNKSLAQRTAFSGGGIGIKAEVPIAGTSGTETYTEPPADGLPEMGEEPAWHSVSSTDVVDSLSDSLTGLDLEFYPASGTGSGLGNVLTLVGSVANTLVSTLEGIIDAALAPLLDPLVDLLLQTLGLNLNQVDVGANLSCEGGGGTLVE